ncbi:MAG: CRTAC1 family protein, partial [Anaerolineae bacterium]|nr:CRTAC1 family protein [Anaerolineae bacterium]
IFWNLGSLTFEKETLPDLNTRAVNIVDVTGDGRLDIVFTHITSSLTYWENSGSGVFERLPLPGVRALAHSMAWGDLNGDGTLDLVTGSYDAELEQVLRDSFMLGGGAGVYYYENQDGTFVPQRLADAAQTLTITLFDVDGDGWLDIVFTRRTGGMTYWHNTGTAGEANRFVRETMPGIAHPAYAMAWADLDNDGDLDLVTGSYDAGLLSDLGNSFLLNKTGGIFVYKNDHGNFRAVPLAGSAQAMAIQLFDADRDGRPDLVVGNDFNVPDYLWLRRDDGWEQSRFDATSHSTMGLDAGDIDNDGVAELFATDMKPYSDDPQTMADWQPVMDGMHDPMLPGDPQIMENVLQVRQSDGSFENRATDWGVDATGWSWSSQFGDLDNDGLLDLYVVNGMAAEELFGQLPGDELVEQNQAFRNDGNRFLAASQWGLDATAGGRGMSMADLDGDGDLDIVVNNLRAPATLYENQLCAGAALEVDLRWPGSKNLNALGARLTLHTSSSALTRSVQAGSGYASGNPGRVHFGFSAGSKLERLDIVWPDGAT